MSEVLCYDIYDASLIAGWFPFFSLAQALGVRVCVWWLVILGNRVRTVLTHGKMLPEAGAIRTSLPHGSGYPGQ